MALANRHRYKDGEPIIPVCRAAQMYYKKHSYPTRVKAAGLLSRDEAMRLAGIDSMTLAPDLLRTLSQTKEPEASVAHLSVFKEIIDDSEQGIERMTFIDDEIKYREAFAKTVQRIALDGNDIDGVLPTDQNVDALYEYLIGGGR